VKKYLSLILIIIFIHSYAAAQDNISKDEMIIDPESIKLLNDQIKAKKPVAQPAIVAPPVVNVGEPETKTTAPVVTNITSGATENSLSIDPESIKLLNDQIKAKKPVAQPAIVAPPVVNVAEPETKTTEPVVTNITSGATDQNNNNISAENAPSSEYKATKAPEPVGYIYSDWSGSIMFDNSLIKLLDSTLMEFSNIAPGNKQVNSKEVAGNDVKSILDLATKNNISPSFYLGSIIFHSIDDWVIWINNKKITAKKRTDLKFIIPQLECLEVNEDYVIFSWKSRMLDDLSPGWKGKLSLVKNSNNYYNANNGINIKDDAVNFRLYPNQTLSIYDMDILEGYVPEHVAVAQTQKAN
jgi:hypothetical protein